MICWLLHAVLVFLLAGLPDTCMCWQNEYNEPLSVTCPTGSAIYRIQYKHDDYYYDNVWQWSCKKHDALQCPDEDQCASCQWSGHVNEWGGDMDFRCWSTTGVIAGVKSEYYNWWGDRRWQFLCCTVPSTNRCQKGDERLTYQINTLYKSMDFVVENFFIGFQSSFGSSYDRRWKAYLADLICSPTQACCTCPTGTNLEYEYEVTDIKFHVDEAAITDQPPLALASEVLHNPSAATTSIWFSVDEAVSFTSSFSHEAGVSLTVGLEIMGGIPSVASATAKVEVTGHYAYTLGQAKTFTKTYIRRFTVTAPPHSSIRATASVFKAQLDVPYTISSRVKSPTQRFETCCTTTGMWQGVAYTELRLTTTDVDVDNGQADLQDPATATAPHQQYEGFSFPRDRLPRLSKWTESLDLTQCIDACTATDGCVGVAREPNLAAASPGTCYNITANDVMYCPRTDNDAMAWFVPGTSQNCGVQDDRQDGPAWNTGP